MKGLFLATVTVALLYLVVTETNGVQRWLEPQNIKSTFTQAGAYMVGVKNRVFDQSESPSAVEQALQQQLQEAESKIDLLASENQRLRQLMIIKEPELTNNDSVQSVVSHEKEGDLVIEVSAAGDEEIRGNRSVQTQQKLRELSGLAEKMELMSIGS